MHNNSKQSELESLKRLAQHFAGQGNEAKAAQYAAEALQIDPHDAKMLKLSSDKGFREDYERWIDTRTKPQYKASALVSVYASERFMRGCLKDLVGQSLYKAGELEIVVIDSASPENEWAIVEEYCSRNEHILAVRTKEREPLYAAWNRGIGLATGEYISNANSDDRHRVDALERMSKELDSNQDVDLVYADCYISQVANEVYDENAKQQLLKNADWFAPAALVFYQFGPMPMWRKSVHDEIGYFDESFKVVGDYDFCLRFAVKCKARHIDEALGLYLLHDEALSFKDDTDRREMDVINDTRKTVEVAKQLYQREGVECDSDEDTAEICVDLANRAMSYHSPIKGGEQTAKPELALKFYQEALRLNPSHKAAIHNIAVLLASVNKTAKAVEILQTSIYASEAEFLQTVALCKDQSRRNELKLMPSSLKLPSQYDLTWNRQSQEYSETASDVEDVTELMKAGISKIEAGQLNDGIEILDRALELDPGNIQILDTLRVIGQNLPPEWEAKREKILADQIRKSDGSERLAKIWQSGQFNNAPLSMQAIWEGVKGAHIPQAAAPSSEPSKVSIVIACHNYGRFLGEAIRSVLAQTIRNWELIIVDDGSTDETPQVIERFITDYKDHRISSIYADNVGAAEARNIGVAVSKAEYLLILDADDMLAADYLEVMLKELEADAGLGFVWPISVQRGRINRLWSNRPFNLTELLIADRLPVTSLTRRSMWDQLGGFSKEMAETYEDWDFWLKAIDAGWRGKLVPEALFLYRKHHNTRSSFEHGFEKETVAKRKLIRRHSRWYKSGADRSDLLAKQMRVHPDLIDMDAVKEYEAQAVNRTAKQVRSIEEKVEPDQKMRVLFYFFKNVHQPILMPIYEEMKRDGGFEIAFAIHPYNEMIRAGFSPDEEMKLRSMGECVVDNPREFKPDITLVADNVASILDGCGKIVNVGHGLLSKGQYFTDSDFIHRENLEHMLCVPGPYHKERIEASGKVFIPIVDCGYPKIDGLFSGVVPARDELMRQMNLDPAKKVILYAPTFNISLSAIPVLWTRIAQLAAEDRYLLMKFHPSTPESFKAAHRELASRHKHVFYVEDLDLTPYLQMADVMVSDVSSAYMEFILLDKPVVLFNNPNQATYENYDPQDIEYAWRDVGIEADDLDGVKAGVERSLSNPAEYSEIRMKYANRLIPARDGRSSYRVIGTIKDLLNDRLSGSTPTLSVVGNDKLELDSTGLRFVDNGEFTLFLPHAVTGGERVLFRLVNHLRRNQELEAVIPMVAGGPQFQDPYKLLGLPENQFKSNQELDVFVKSRFIAQILTVQEVDLSQTVWMGRTDSKVVQDYMNRMSSDTKGSLAGSTAGLAMDAVVYNKTEEAVRTGSKRIIATDKSI